MWLNIKHNDRKAGSEIQTMLPQARGPYMTQLLNYMALYILILLLYLFILLIYWSVPLATLLGHSDPLTLGSMHPHSSHLNKDQMSCTKPTFWHYMIWMLHVGYERQMNKWKTFNKTCGWIPSPHVCMNGWMSATHWEVAQVRKQVHQSIPFTFVRSDLTQIRMNEAKQLQAPTTTSTWTENRNARLSAREDLWQKCVSTRSVFYFPPAAEDCPATPPRSSLPFYLRSGV